MTALGSGAANAYSQVSLLAYGVSEQSITPTDVTYTADLNLNKFIKNTYIGNFYTGGRSMI